jgi:hypothetical protein
MHWYAYLAYFFAGMFLIKAVPHFSNGVSGRGFPSPFADPPGKGESSPTVNVLWGSFNLAVGYWLLARVGEFTLSQTSAALVLAAGGLFMALMLARVFGRIYAPHQR